MQSCSLTLTAQEGGLSLTLAEQEVKAQISALRRARGWGKGLLDHLILKKQATASA